jgi:hypothetical protein
VCAHQRFCLAGHICGQRPIADAGYPSSPCIDRVPRTRTAQRSAKVSHPLATNVPVAAAWSPSASGTQPPRPAAPPALRLLMGRRSVSPGEFSCVTGFRVSRGSYPDFGRFVTLKFVSDPCQYINRKRTGEIDLFRIILGVKIATLQSRDCSRE